MSFIDEGYTSFLKIKKQENLYEYSRFGKRIQKTLPIHFFGTGSKGNSLYIPPLHLLIDLGFPYKRYAELDANFFSDVQAIVLTHEHSDHLNPATLMRILKLYPHIKFYISPNMGKAIVSEKFQKPNRSNGLTKANQELLTTKYKNRFIPLINKQTILAQSPELIKYAITPHYTTHGDIYNVALEITTATYFDGKNDGLHILYASDLDTLDEIKDNPNAQGLPHGNNLSFNLIFLEANYDRKLVEQALKIDPNDIKAKGNLRHISEQDAKAYVEKYLSDDGVFIPLHASSTYGTLIQDLK